MNQHLTTTARIISRRAELDTGLSRENSKKPPSSKRSKPPSKPQRSLYTSRRSRRRGETPSEHLLLLRRGSPQAKDTRCCFYWTWQILFFLGMWSGIALFTMDSPPILTMDFDASLTLYFVLHDTQVRSRVTPKQLKSAVNLRNGSNRCSMSSPWTFNHHLCVSLCRGIFGKCS